MHINSKSDKPIRPFITREQAPDTADLESLQSNSLTLEYCVVPALIKAVVVVFISMCVNSSPAQPAPEAGSSSRQCREQAINLIPYRQLNGPTQKKVSDVVDNASLYRRLPVQSINADPDYFRFLVRYPEVIVNIWQMMGVTQMTTARVSPFTLETNDGVGTTSALDLVYGNENLHVFFGTGTYEGPVFKRKVNGRCVLILRSEHRADKRGEDAIVSQMDIFLKLDNVGANLVAKSISPIVGPTADQNFIDSLKFVQRLNENTVENGPGVQQMANRLNIDEDVREKYIEVAGLVYERGLSKKGNTSVVPVAPATNQQFSVYRTQQFSRQPNSQVDLVNYPMPVNDNRTNPTMPTSVNRTHTSPQGIAPYSSGR